LASRFAKITAALPSGAPFSCSVFGLRVSGLFEWIEALYQAEYKVEGVQQ